MYVYREVFTMIISLLLSAAFGYVAAKLMNVEGKWYVYVLLGLAGGLVGDIVFGLVGFSSHGWLANAIVAIVGACIVIFLFRKLTA